MPFQENRIPVATVLAVDYFDVQDHFKVGSDGALKISLIGQRLKELLAEGAIVERDVPAVAMAQLMPHLPAERLSVAWAHAFHFLREAPPGSYSFHVLDAEGTVRILMASCKDGSWNLEIQELRYEATSAHVAFSLNDPFVVLSFARDASRTGELAA